MTKYLGVAILLVGCGVDANDAPVDIHEKAPASLLARFEDQQAHSFIVEIPRAATFARGTHVARIATRVDISLEHDWDQLPLVQVRAQSLEAALAMLDSDDVERAYEPIEYELADAQSFPLIGQPAAAAAGKTGAGTAVAVLDTGANYTLGEFGCTAPNTPAGCHIAYAADFAPNDGALDDNGHGTNVAGIVAGVAPGTKVLALDVFAGQTASSTDILSALNWVLANRTTYNIASLNLSLGGGMSTTTCTGDAVGAALASARAVGIAPIVASGNNGYTNATSWPACAPAAISVGAVYDTNVGGLGFSTCSDATTAADKITCFSNSASFLTLLAPGAMITAGGTTMAGTSQATPHVAGAFAVLHAAFPTDTVDQSLTRLTATGKKIVDPRNNVTKPRIDIGAAVAAAAPVDTTPPTGTVGLVGGGTTTRAIAVTLAIAGSDASGVASMCITNTTTCTAFETFATQRAWTLPAGDGAKTVTVFLRDTKGNTTTSTTSPRVALRLDTIAPSNGSMTAVAGTSTVALSWAGFADAGSGIARYRLATAAGATAPSTCATVAWEGTTTAINHVGLIGGTTYSYRVCAVDAAGNVSSGTVATATPHELDPPVGSLKINAGATLSKSRTVSLALTATDASGVTQMCISATTTCTAWVTPAATMTYTFPADGAQTLRAWFRDRWGTTSAPATATIVVDTVAPTSPALSTTAALGRITLGWTAATDATSGLASYKLVGANGTTAPASCAVGTVIYAGTARTFAHTVAAKATWSYRVCATDVAGNTSTGTTRTITAR